jgi:hypothetical protein
MRGAGDEKAERAQTRPGGRCAPRSGGTAGWVGGRQASEPQTATNFSHYFYYCNTASPPPPIRLPPGTTGTTSNTIGRLCGVLDTLGPSVRPSVRPLYLIASAPTVFWFFCARERKNEIEQKGKIRKSFLYQYLSADIQASAVSQDDHPIAPDHALARGTRGRGRPPRPS